MLWAVYIFCWPYWFCNVRFVLVRLRLINTLLHYIVYILTASVKSVACCSACLVSHAAPSWHVRLHRGSVVWTAPGLVQLSCLRKRGRPRSARKGRSSWLHRVPGTSDHRNNEFSTILTLTVKRCWNEQIRTNKADKFGFGEKTPTERWLGVWKNQFLPAAELKVTRSKDCVPVFMSEMCLPP